MVKKQEKRKKPIKWLSPKIDVIFQILFGEVGSEHITKKFLEAIGYKELMKISEDDVSYIKNGLKLTIKNVINGDNLIEIETSDIPGFSTIEDLKEKLLELKLPIDTSNFFIKKAEIELGKALNR